ncbi:MAG: hypothetical protein ABIA12_01585 [Candidatus Aenigmatarchaeota archaeon]
MERIDDIKRIIFSRDRFKFDVWKHMYFMLSKFLSTYYKKFPKASIRSFKIDLKAIKKDGRRKYEMKAGLITHFGNFFAEKSGWGARETFGRMLSSLRKQVWAAKTQRQNSERGRKNKTINVRKIFCPVCGSTAIRPVPRGFRCLNCKARLEKPESTWIKIRKTPRYIG